MSPCTGLALPGPALLFQGAAIASDYDGSARRWQNSSEVLGAGQAVRSVLMAFIDGAPGPVRSTSHIGFPKLLQQM
jgi:hypothetical protein